MECRHKCGICHCFTCFFVHSKTVGGKGSWQQKPASGHCCSPKMASLYCRIAYSKPAWKVTVPASTTLLGCMRLNTCSQVLAGIPCLAGRIFKQAAADVAAEAGAEIGPLAFAVGSFSNSSPLLSSPSPA